MKYIRNINVDCPQTRTKISEQIVTSSLYKEISIQSILNQGESSSANTKNAGLKSNQ